jgi:hypothetical protein
MKKKKRRSRTRKKRKVKRVQVEKNITKEREIIITMKEMVSIQIEKMIHINNIRGSMEKQQMMFLSLLKRSKKRIPKWKKITATLNNTPHKTSKNSHMKTSSDSATKRSQNNHKPESKKLETLK